MDVHQQEHASIEVEGTPFEVISLVGQEAISSLFRFEVLCRAHIHVADPSSMIAHPAILTLRDGFGTERRIFGLVTQAKRRVSDSETAQLHLVVRPLVFPLTLGRMSRVFQDATVIDIVKKVLQDSDIATRWEVFATYTHHEYCAQYREDDWTFVSRMLEEEGIYYWFDHGDETTTLVFDDYSKSAPDLVGGSTIAFAYESGLHADREIIEELGTRIEAKPTKFTIASFNQQNPRLKLNESVGKGLLEFYDAPGAGPEAPQACFRRATLLKEAATCASAGVTGLSSSIRLVPGRVMCIEDHPLARLNGRFLVTEASYRITQRRRNTTSNERPYRCYFGGVRHDLLFRPYPKSPPAKQAGLQTAIVVGMKGSEVFPDATGRVRVQLHWDREGTQDDTSGKWMRVHQRGVSNSMLLPRVGWNVLTFNEEGDVDAPAVLGRIHDGEHRPTYPLPANKTRVVFKTATTPGGGSYNEIYFEDKKGAEEMFINASRDMTLYTQHVKLETVNRDSLHTVGQNHDLTVEGDYFDTISNDQRVTIGANERIQVGKARVKEINGGESALVSGNRTVAAGSTHTVSVKETRNLTVGGSLVEKTSGGIGAVAGGNVILDIGGSHTKTSQMSIVEDVGKSKRQSIGGSKLEFAKTNRLTGVAERYTENIGGSMTLNAGGAFGDGAIQRAFWTVSGHLSSSAKEVYMEAKDKIQLRCGASIITLLPDSVSIVTPSFDLSESEHIEVIAKKIMHN